MAQAYSVSRRVLEDAIVAEADRDRHAPADLQSEEARLRQRLARLRLDMLVMQGDGNCQVPRCMHTHLMHTPALCTVASAYHHKSTQVQFRAVSFGLYGTEDRHSEVRGRAIAYMRRNPAAFAVFLGEDWGDYLQSMARLGTWGDELTLVRHCYG